MFYWDETLRKFRDANGRVISDERLRRLIDAACASLAVLFIARAEMLRQDFTVDNFQIWNIQTRIDLISLHYAMMMMAFGGPAQMNVNEWKQAEDKIAFHYGFFESFATGVITGAVLMDGTFPIRTGLYAEAGHSTYQSGVRIREANAGKTEERRITRSGKPCVDCKTAAALGWSPIGSLPEIGDSVCIVRCRCFFEYR